VISEDLRERLKQAGESTILPYMDHRAYADDLVSLVFDHARDPLLGRGVYPDLFIVGTMRRESYLLSIEERLYLVHDEGYIEAVSKMLSLLDVPQKSHEVGVLYRFVVEQAISSNCLSAAGLMLGSVYKGDFPIEPREPGFRFRSSHTELGVTSYFSFMHRDEICRLVVVGHELGHFAARSDRTIQEELTSLMEQRVETLSKEEIRNGKWYVASEDFAADVFAFWSVVGTCLSWPDADRPGFLTWVIGSYLLALAVMCMLEAVREIHARGWFLEAEDPAKEISKCLELKELRYSVHENFVTRCDSVQPPGKATVPFAKHLRIDALLRDEYVHCATFVQQKIRESINKIASFVLETCQRPQLLESQVVFDQNLVDQLHSALRHLLAEKDDLALMGPPTHVRMPGNPTPSRRNALRLQRGRFIERPAVQQTHLPWGTILHFAQRIVS
jgi:hypothetical protein